MGIKSGGKSGFRTPQKQIGPRNGPKQTTGQTKASVSQTGDLQVASDVFDRPLTSPQGKQLEKLVSESSAHPSLLENLNNLLQNKQSQLLQEYGSLSHQAQSMTAELANGGFSQNAIEKKRPELLKLRQQMSELRKRLNSIHRRLKISSSQMADLPEFGLGRRLGTQFQSLRQMQPGVARALAFLELAGHVYPKSANPHSQNTLRTTIPSDLEKHALGSYLARAAPNAQLAQAAASLLKQGPQHMQGNLPANTRDAAIHLSLQHASEEASSLQGIAAFRDLQNPIAEKIDAE